MKTYHCISLLLVCSFTGAFALNNDLNRLINDLIRQDTAVATAKSVLAVMPFNCGLKGEPPGAGRAVAEYAVAFFANQPKYTLVERMEFAKVARELALSQSGMIDEKKALEAGKMLSAEIIVTGNIGEVMGARMISARMVRTETGKVIAASSITIGADKMQVFYKDALGERTQNSGSIFRSLVAPGWGQFYTNHPVQGWVCGTAAAGVVGALIWSAFDFADKNSFYDSLVSAISNDLSKKDKALDESTDAYNRTMLITGITIGVWAINLIDAAILGRNEKRRVKELYFSANCAMPGMAVAFDF